MAGGTKTAKGRTCGKWSAVTVNKMVAIISQVFAEAQRQGLVSRNVAALVDRAARALDTHTDTEVRTLLASIVNERLAHAWELSLSGVRRGEISELRWADVDVENRSLSITNKPGGGREPLG